MAANHAQASEQNEQNWLWIKSDSGPDIVITQVAGLIARRIVCWPEIGDRVVQGERFGMIRFGSRMDVYVPENSEVLVSQGQACLCGRNRFMSNESVKKRRSRRKRWRRESKARRGIYIWPNLFTTANLFSGFFGIVSSINGDFELAAIAIFASCIFDILDGKIARLTGGTSRFGVEYDSLSDLVAFGVGPGLLMYLMALKPYGRVGWLAAFLFMACGALRLARFNVQVETTSKKYFVGLPIPGGAAMIAATVLFLSHWSIAVHGSLISFVLLGMTFVLGFFMISTMPYNSFKDIEFIMARPSFVMFGVIVLVTIIAVTPAVHALFSPADLHGFRSRKMDRLEDQGEKRVSGRRSRPARTLSANAGNISGGEQPA